MIHWALLIPTAFIACLGGVLIMCLIYIGKDDNDE